MGYIKSDMIWSIKKFNYLYVLRINYYNIYIILDDYL